MQNTHQAGGSGRLAISRGEPAIAKVARREFGLTILSDDSLSRRLMKEIRFVVEGGKNAWPKFKRDPISFTAHLLADLSKQLPQRQHVLPAALALLLVCCAVVSIAILDRRAPLMTQSVDLDDLSEVATINLSLEEKPQSNSGVGASQKGRVGFQNGKGEGSNPEPAKAHGGGGSGARAVLPPQVGKIPQPSEILAPVPPLPRRNPALPVAGADIDPALWKDLPFRTYGDPLSKSNTQSNGPGDGGAIGTGNGLGFGEGNGPGFGPGRDGNMGGDKKSIGGGGKGGGSGHGVAAEEPDRVFTGPQVTERARVLSKPEPQYTEEARKKDISGTVVLRVVFSSSGEITNIRAMQSLPGGLTEKAIAAARQIRFVPAKRDGHPVSMYMQLEYNFNLY